MLGLDSFLEEELIYSHHMLIKGARFLQVTNKFYYLPLHLYHSPILNYPEIPSSDSSPSL